MTMEDNAAVGVKVDGVYKEKEKKHMTAGGGGEIGGGRRRVERYVNSMSSREMESLTAICDAFLPRVNVEKGADDESALEFYRTSASMAGTPDHIGGMLSERVQHPKLWLIRVVLWLLSTWIGTLIICGRASLSNHFPYVHKISDVSPLKREEILKSWSRSSISLLRTLYLGAKLVVSLVFFSQVNEKDENLSWKAIDYAGPDPEFKINTKNTQKSTFQDSENPETEANLSKKELLYGPLYRGLIDLKQPGQMILESLQRANFQVSTLLPIKKRVPPNLSIFPSKVIKCDAVVVGSGSGGGVIAGVLAKAGYKVIVLEKGSYCARTNLSLLEGQTMDQMYLGNGLLASSDMGVVVLAGSTVGGGSAINWAASIRTPQHVLNEWSESYGIELFQSVLYKEAMDVVCEKMGVQSEVENEGLSSTVLRKGCNKLGYSVSNVPRNSPSDHYCGWCCLGCKDGKKKGTSETWLVDLVNSGNGVILPGCEAVQVMYNKKKGQGRSIASGVVFEFQYGGHKERFLVESKVTIAACGALCTPELLKRSGLKNPNIGRNLHLHPVTMGWGYFPGTEKKSYEGEILTAMSTVVGNFKTSGYGAIIQTPALHPGMFSALMPWVSAVDFKKRMSKFSRTAHIFALARDKGTGVLSSPTSISYRMDKTDEENLQTGLERVLRILAAAGAEEIGTHHGDGRTLNVQKASLSEFEEFVKEESLRGMRDLSTPICSAHQMGSCRMGVEQLGSAVNPMGETWEVEGLYVADSSVFPTALGVNPMVTVQAIAYCTAQSVLEALKRKKKTD